MQHCHPLVANEIERRQVRLGDGIGGRQLQVLEIYERSSLFHAEVEMRSAGQAGHAYQSNALALLNTLTATNETSREMQVIRLVSIGVLQDDEIAIAAFHP